MNYNPGTGIYHRKSIRLKEYDYSKNGAYFITVCAQNKECLFGEISDDCRGKKSFAPMDAGKIAEQCWREIPKHYPNVLLDEFIVMPNHVHGILVIENNIVANNYSPLRNGTSKTVGAIIRGYKIGVTKWMRKNTNIYQVWQRNYYEHIVRNDSELNCIREYINNNPMNWETDDESGKVIKNYERS